ncbi:MAG: oligosaccharide flippase family protein, partial [Candidatus Falkowbacteria bacterium]|nr:oligosaccharide flippase family protein [Candidatus Falkowbacteria bacterium]
MSKVHQIAKNTSYFTLALILQKVLSFTYFAIIARALGPEDLGKYYFAISFTSIFAIFIDFGLSNTQTREIAKNNSKAQEITSLVLAIKIPLLIVIYSFVAILVNLMHYP